MKTEKILSVLIDESGDFGKYDYHDPYYHVVMVLHNQANNINKLVRDFEKRLSNLENDTHYIHVGPLIRREKPYINETREARRTLFNALFHFTRNAPIEYICISINKRENKNASVIEYTEILSKAIVKKLKAHSSFFNDFDKLIVYYDNGQVELARVLVSVFNALFTKTEFRIAKPTDYRLLQVADLICTVELAASKETLSKSEMDFFHSKRHFEKNILKYIRKKQRK